MNGNQTEAQMGPADMLIAEYKAQMSDLMHTAMATQTNFRIVSARVEALEKENASLRARITEMETSVANAEVKVDEQGFPYLAADNAAREGDEAA